MEYFESRCNAAFLRTGPAQYNVYFRPPRERKDKNQYWLLLTAAYGFVNANAEFQKSPMRLF